MKWEIAGEIFFEKQLEDGIQYSYGGYIKN